MNLTKSLVTLQPFWRCWNSRQCPWHEAVSFVTFQRAPPFWLPRIPSLGITTPLRQFMKMCASHALFSPGRLFSRSLMQLLPLFTLQSYTVHHKIRRQEYLQSVWHITQLVIIQAQPESNSCLRMCYLTNRSQVWIAKSKHNVFIAYSANHSHSSDHMPITLLIDAHWVRRFVV